jgi:hypothetical protein
MNYNWTEIKEKTVAAVNACKAASDEANDALFFKNINEKWSIAENLVHLAKSVKGVNRAMSLGKEQMCAVFGIPQHEPIDYTSLFNRYQAILSTGVKAPPPFVPQITLPTDSNGEGDTRQSVTELFDNQHNSLVENMSLFSEEDLDNYQMPHPAFGNLRIREMLYFTIFHIEHHRKAIQKILKN